MGWSRWVGVDGLESVGECVGVTIPRECVGVSIPRECVGVSIPNKETC